MPAVDARGLLQFTPHRSVRHVLVAGFLQALTECGHHWHVAVRRCAVEEPDHRHCRLLRARRERPCRRAAEQRDELAPSHSITSSARGSNAGGTSTLAALRLITNSDFTGGGLSRRYSDCHKSGVDEAETANTLSQEEKAGRSV